MSNRIGEQCWYPSRDPKTGQTSQRLGWLRMWGQDYEEFQNGVGLYPIAVVEDFETFNVVVVRIDCVTFCSKVTE